MATQSCFLNYLLSNDNAKTLRINAEMTKNIYVQVKIRCRLFYESKTGDKEYADQR